MRLSSMARRPVGWLLWSWSQSERTFARNVRLVELPTKAAYSKFPNPASRYAMAGVFVAKDKAGTRVAVTGAGESGVFRHKGLEYALNKSFTVASAAAVKIDAADLNADIHASAAYRANLISVQAQRAVAKMLG